MLILQVYWFLLKYDWNLNYRNLYLAGALWVKVASRFPWLLQNQSYYFLNLKMNIHNSRLWRFLMIKMLCIDSEVSMFDPWIRGHLLRSREVSLLTVLKSYLHEICEIWQFSGIGSNVLSESSRRELKFFSQLRGFCGATVFEICNVRILPLFLIAERKIVKLSGSKSISRRSFIYLLVCWSYYYSVGWVSTKESIFWINYYPILTYLRTLKTLVSTGTLPIF